MGLFGNTAKASAQKIYKNIVIFGANNFPDIMNEAQLQTFADAVQTAGMDLAKLKNRLSSDTKDLDEAQAAFDTMANAARTLLARKETATPEELPTIEKGITEAKNELITRKATLADATRRKNETAEDISNKEADLKKAADFLLTARKKISDATNEKERLTDELARQKQREKEARKNVGVGSFDTSSSVLDAMTERNSKLREQVEGLRSATDAIEKASTPTHSSALQDALDAGKTTKSDSDALKDLLG